MADRPLPTRSWPNWFESRLPTKDECSIGLLLARRAAAAPDEAFALSEEGGIWTNAQANAASRALAAQFYREGVRAGDIVALWQPNGRNMLAAIFACSILGATAAQINIAFRGAMLVHALGIAGARALFAHGELVERLGAAEFAQIEVILVAEAVPAGSTDPRIRQVRWDDPGAETMTPVALAPSSLAAIIFTSGTTGPSKGVRVTCAQLWSLGRAFYGFMTEKDRMLLVLPLFHIASLGALWGALSAGGSVAIMEAFRTGDFWNVVRRTGATTNMGLAASLIDLLMKAEPSPQDREHSMRCMLISACSPSVRAFSQRFGVDVFAGFSMSETSGVTVSDVNPAKDHSVGRARNGIELRLVDEHDVAVPVGQPGELILRANLPWILNDGYQAAPEATVSAWRNGWFHTGDLFVADAEGDLYFIDRLKDAIRRRGENISSAEVEAEILAFPAASLVAAIGVNTPEGEEVLVAVAPRSGETIDPLELVNFLIPRMPHYMVPRFIRILPQLPMTQTNKVQKSELRAQGVTPDTWDRERAGIILHRSRLPTR